MKKNEFFNGYEIYDANNIKKLDKIKNDIYKIFIKNFKLKEKNANLGFNNFHKLIDSRAKITINSKRIKVINEINSNKKLGQSIFNLFENQISNLFGYDILIQKNINLVIQMPNDPNPSEIHRDAPLNSSYEVVLWLPLVDCFSTKSMYILDYKSSNKCLNILKKNKLKWKNFEKIAKSKSKNPRVNYGQALFFHSGLLHGSNINKTNETRISLNLRFKNLFSPSGLKNQLQYYKPLRISNITKIGAIIDSQEIF